MSKIKADDEELAEILVELPPRGRRVTAMVQHRMSEQLRRLQATQVEQRVGQQIEIGCEAEGWHWCNSWGSVGWVSTAETEAEGWYLTARAF